MNQNLAFGIIAAVGLIILAVIIILSNREAKKGGFNRK